MVFQGKVLCGFGSDVNYLIGTNSKGYLFHLTAERCIRYGYVDEEEMKQTSFSIVRNPFSRAVSMYEYNKRPFETFSHFVRDFHERGMKHFHERNETDSNKIYCHILPMHAYTHMNGKQVVNTIIKQEHLKRLVGTNWKDSGVPANIQQALTGIPHANSRKRKVAWQDYYSQETMDLVLDMYAEDFDIFGYDKTIPGRGDLVPQIPARVKTRQTRQLSVRIEHSGSAVVPNISSSSVLSEPEDFAALEAGRLKKLAETSFTSPPDNFSEIERNIEKKAEVKRKSSLKLKNPPTIASTFPEQKFTREKRRVSIVNEVETKLYEATNAPNKPFSELDSFDIDRAAVSIGRRATSAGEETSEFIPYKQESVAPTKSSLSAAANANNSDRKLMWKSEWQEVGRQSAMSLSNKEEFERDMFRKKRSASAFILQVQ